MFIVFGYGKQPVGREPRTAGVDQREDAGAGDGEERHRFGEPVDRRAPVLLEQQQDRRDERAGVADADPPDEVDDREPPADRDVDAPDPGAFEEQPGDRHQQHHRQHEADEEAEEPAVRMAPRQDDRGDLLGDRAERVSRRDDRRRARMRVSGPSVFRRRVPGCRFELGIRVPQRREIRRPRPRIEVLEERRSCAPVS